MSAEPLTNQDWAMLCSRPGVCDFPKLIRGQCKMTAHKNEKYNCIAWAMGVTDQWILPPHDKEAMDGLCIVAHATAALAGGQLLTFDRLVLRLKIMRKNQSHLRCSLLLQQEGRQVYSRRPLQRRTTVLERQDRLLPSHHPSGGRTRRRPIPPSFLRESVALL